MSRTIVKAAPDDNAERYSPINTATKRELEAAGVARIPRGLTMCQAEDILRRKRDAARTSTPWGTDQAHKGAGGVTRKHARTHANPATRP